MFALLEEVDTIVVLEDFSDDFNRANSTTLGNGWTEALGSWQILSNRLRRDAAATFDFVRQATEMTDCYAECVPLDINIGPAIRMQDPPDDEGGYLLAPVLTGNHIALFRRNKTTLEWDTILDQVAVTTNLSSDRLRIRAIGTTITGWKNDTQIIEVTDGNFLNGFAGIAVADGDTGALDADNYVEGEL